MHVRRWCPTSWPRTAKPRQRKSTMNRSFPPYYILIYVYEHTHKAEKEHHEKVLSSLLYPYFCLWTHSQGRERASWKGMSFFFPENPRDITRDFFLTFGEYWEDKNEPPLICSCPPLSVCRRGRSTNTTGRRRASSWWHRPCSGPRACFSSLF